MKEPLEGSKAAGPEKRDEKESTQEDVLPSELSHKVSQLSTAINELSEYLHDQSMDCYFHSLLGQLNGLFNDVNVRLTEISTFYRFLVPQNLYLLNIVHFSAPPSNIKFMN